MQGRFLMLALAGCTAEAAFLPSDPGQAPTFVFEDPGALRTPQSSSPISLTASDGTGLHLVAMKVRAHMTPPLAFTEMKMTFQNPTPRQLEGRFTIRLPDGASISRLAMKINGRWMEGEVVERRRAQQTYESFLHRRRDPALLEHGSGNVYSARVFPIPARGVKELIVSYSQEIIEQRLPLRVPLLGLPKVGELDARVTVAPGREVFRLQKRDTTPNADIVLDPPPLPPSGLRHESLVVVKVRPNVQAQRDPLHGLLILVDTSASRAPYFSRQALLLKRLVEGLARGARPKTPIAIATFDQETRMLFEGPANAFGASHFRRLIDRRALGATDLEGALRWASTHMGAGPHRYSRCLLISDAAVTAGADDRALLDAVRALAWVGVERLDALAVGGFKDRAQLQRLVQAGLQRNGVVLDGRSRLDRIAKRLQRSTRSGLRVTARGARWVWPQTLDGVQPGDQVLIYADLPKHADLQLAIDGAPHQLDGVLVQTERPLLERAWVKARLDMLEAAHAGLSEESRAQRSALVQQMTALSVQHRVLSPYTALLVLETEWDYRRFGIDRRAKANILAFKDDRLRVLARRRDPGGLDGNSVGLGSLEQDRKIADRAGLLGVLKGAGGEVSNVFGPGGLGTGINNTLGGLRGTSMGDAGGAGGLGTRGIGAGGGGSSSGIGGLGTYGHGRGTGGYGNINLGGRGKGTVRIRPGRTIIKGSLSKEHINRVIRRNLARFKYCYEKQLNRSPNLRGKVSVRFSIAPTGAVAKSAIHQSSMGNRAVETCVAKVMRSLKFPKPKGGGIVIVKYPFVFDSSGWTSRIYSPPRPRPPAKKAAYKGRFAQIKRLLDKGAIKRALTQARSWREEAPGDVLALVAMGEAAVASGDTKLAARAFGSLIDLFPERAEFRRHAGARLEGIGTQAALQLAIDTYKRARDSRPDHPSGHRALAFAQLKSQKPEAAFQTITGALRTGFRTDRFSGVYRVLREDAGLIGAALIKAQPQRRNELQRTLRSLGAEVHGRPSTRFVLHWETDASDVNMHITDGKKKYMSSYTWGHGGGWALYGNVTNGYGPEAIAVQRPAEQLSYPLNVWVRYKRQRAAGYTLGKLQIIQHDGQGGLSFSERPFTVMKSGGAVELGALQGPMSAQ